MGIGTQTDRSHPLQQVPEGGIATQVQSQHQGVDEEPDQSLGLGASPIGDGSADQQVLLAAEARQQHGESRQQGHEQRDRGASAQGAQAVGQGAGQGQGQLMAAEALHGGTGMVGGQVQVLRRALQLLLPVGQQAGEGWSVQPLALPGGDVSVLEGQGRQGRGQVEAAGGVERAQVAREEVHRPAISDDVVEGEQQEMLLGSQAQQADAPQRAVRQVERLACLLLRQAVGDGLAGRVVQGVQIEQRQRNRAGGSDHLSGQAGGSREGGAQGGMTVGEGVQACGQGGPVQRAAQAHGQGNVVERMGGHQLVQEPQALLGKGEREVLGARRWLSGGGERGNRRRERRGLQSLQVSGQGGHGGLLKEEGEQETLGLAGLGGQVRGEGGQQAREDLGGQQGVAA